MTLIRDKETILPGYEEFSNYFTEEKERNHIDYEESNRKPIEEKHYVDKSLPYGYTLIIDRLDEIESLIKTTVASKGDIKKSKDEIINEQKSQIQELKEYLGRLLLVLDKKSTPRIFSAISLVALIISTTFLLITIIFGELILTKTHFLVSTIGFILMFVMARLSQKIHYERNS